MQQSDGAEYSDAMVEALEVIWGSGFLSPGGPDEVARVVAGLDLRGAAILDIGCGVGGIDFLLAETHGAGEVIGVDVEAANIERAKIEAARRGLSGRIHFLAVEAGALPFPAERFDIVFSKDAIIHIADKEAVFADIWRVLKPGGWFAASDWLRGDDAPPSDEMRRYIEAEGLSFAMGSPQQYRCAMNLAGFAEITMVDRNAWYARTARAELAAINGPLHRRLIDGAGRVEATRLAQVWERMLVVLDSGELRPIHLRGRKPG
jgi:ubiquinone/menaquinone biosynthesis C-methylase UbiE